MQKNISQFDSLNPSNLSPLHTSIIIHAKTTFIETRIIVWQWCVVFRGQIADHFFEPAQIYLMK